MLRLAVKPLRTAIGAYMGTASNLRHNLTLPPLDRMQHLESALQLVQVQPKWSGVVPMLDAELWHDPVQLWVDTPITLPKQNVNWPAQFSTGALNKFRGQMLVSNGGQDLDQQPIQPDHLQL